MRSSSAARSKAGWLPLGLLERGRFAPVRGGRLRGGRRGRGDRFPGRKGGHVLFELSLAFGHLLAVEIVGLNGLLQFESHVFFPVALQAVDDLFFTGLNARVAQGRQCSRIALATHNGANHSLSAYPAEIADGIVKCTFISISAFCMC